MSTDDDDAHMDAHWQHLSAVEAQRDAPSITIHTDVDVIDGWGFVVKNGRPLLKPGDGLGWVPEHFAHMAEKYDLSDLSGLQVISNSGRAIDVMLSFPGGYTFGHWPIDVSARIERALAVFSLDDLAFIVPGPLVGWAQFFLDAYDIPAEAVIAVPDRHLYQSRVLALPLARFTDYLSPNPHGLALSRLKTHGLALAGKKPDYGERIFVRHRAQTSVGRRTTLGNEKAIELVLHSSGFSSIFPLEMSMADQIAAFSAAKVVVGEDSSALHSIIYSTSATLVVINSISRKNLLHLSICNLLGHDCRYIFVEDKNDGTFDCDVGRLIDTIAHSR